MKRTHSKRCRDRLTAWQLAKRLECVRFSAAFGSMVGPDLSNPLRKPGGMALP
jgi:hypothetical protein